MRVLFITTGTKADGGGMFHSIITIADALHKNSDDTEVRILQIGTAEMPIFDKALVRVDRIVLKDLNIFNYLRLIREYCKLYKPTHVQAFDNRSYFFARLIARSVNSKLYLGRPGGPNPKFYFPKFSDIIVFSEEGEAYFKNKFPKSGVHLIPQRVNATTPDVDRVEKLRKLLKSGSHTLLRIGRIGPFHNYANLKTFSLADRLRKDGINVQAVHIGFVESDSSLSELMSASGQEDLIITDPNFTTNAARLISAADVVLGTGRSLVEGAMLGKPVLTPLAETDFPVLVGEDNLNNLAATNFSARNRLPESDAESCYNKIRSLFINPDAYKNAARFSQEVIGSRYHVDAAIPMWRTLYKKDQRRISNGLLGWDIILNGLLATYWYVTTSIRRKKT